LWADGFGVPWLQMSAADYVIDLLLIGVVFRQLRARELRLASTVLPLALVAVAAAHYLHPYAASGADIVLAVGLGLAGLALGALSGLLTAVWLAPDRVIVAQAGAAAAAAWVVGMGFRFGFAVYSTHAGRVPVARFSARHGISGAQAWTTALVLMAVAEVLARVTVMQVRRRRLARA
jgi:hypothetical protein